MKFYTKKLLALKLRARRMPSMNTFTFLTFERPLAIPSDVSAAILKHSFAFVSDFIAEEGYSIVI